MSPDSITDIKWTYSKMLKELPAESRYELRNNELIDMSSPSEIHQQIVFRLTLIIGSFIVNNKLGKFYTSPLDVIFDEGTVMQPDLIFVAEDHKSIIKEKGIFGAPDVLIEIVSKSSIQRDYIDKKQDYERFGVQEYWIVD
ncbi:MAG: Uma2 family endonuclease, partial [Saprospiraceae bacterium]